jgi:hypothetical protein
MLPTFGLACAVESIRKRKGTDRASIHKTRCFSLPGMNLSSMITSRLWAPLHIAIA